MNRETRLGFRPVPDTAYPPVGDTSVVAFLLMFNFSIFWHGAERVPKVEIAKKTAAEKTAAIK